MTVAAIAATALLAGCPPQPGTQQAPPELPQVTCTGKVVDAAGKAVVGATVTAHRTIQEYVYDEGTPRRIGEVSTRADGGFSFRASPDRGEVIFVVRKKGLAIGWGHWSTLQGDLETKIELEQPSVLAGTVVDEAGSPVAGATVMLSLRPRMRGRRGWRLRGHKAIEATVARTDRDGRFSFDDVPISCAGQFEAEAVGYGRLSDAHGRGAPQYSPPRSDVRLELPAEAKIEAVVVEKETGKPVSDVAPAAVSSRPTPAQYASCISKAEGRFRWDKLPGGRYLISLAVPYQGTAEWAAAPVDVEAKPGETTGVKIEVTRGGIAEVSVVDAEDRTHLDGAFVNLWNDKERWYLGAHTGADGIARVRLLPGTYRLTWVSASDYSSSRSAGSVTVVRDETAPLEVALKKLPRYHGVVRDAAGKPIAGATVCLARGYQAAQTNTAGKFELSRRFRSRRRPADGLLLARHVERNLAATVQVSDPATPIDVRLLPAMTVAGKVTDPGGEPLLKAMVSVVFDRNEPESLRWLGSHPVDGAGRYEIRALPAGRDYAVRASAKSYSAVDVPVPATAAEANRVELSEIALRPVRRNAPAPVVKEIPIPQTPGEWAIWGATGRDARGHIWFAVTAHEIDLPSSHLFEYDPQTRKVVDRGDVVSALKRCGAWREGEGQMKIHTKILQAADGHLYFASMDEEGEDEDAEKLPTWGGHLWRLRLPEYKWEHLLTVPEALIAAGGTGKRIYTMGYFGHVLYQYDIATGKHRSVKVGAFGGHVSRNILVDGRDHVYVPRLSRDDAGQPAAALVEYDAELKEIAQTPLPYYFNGRPVSSHGITGLQKLPDGSIAFVTHNGWMSLIQPSGEGPAKVTDLGWFHPDGPNYTASLFADATGRFLMGAVRGEWDQPYVWVVYDLQTRTHSVAPFEAARPEGLDLDRASLYGSQARDDAGNCYVVGVIPRGRFGNDSRPILLQVRPAR